LTPGHFCEKYSSIETAAMEPQMTKRPALRELDRTESKLFRVMYTPAATPEAVAAYEAAAEECRKYREAHDLLGKRGY